MNLWGIYRERANSLHPDDRRALLAATEADQRLLDSLERERLLPEPTER